MSLVSWLAPHAAWMALILGGAFGVVAPWVARRTRPAIGTWMLSLGSLASAAAALMVFGLFAAPFVGQADGVADSFHWSPKVLRHDSPLGRTLSGIAIAVLVALIGRASRTAWRQCAGLRRSARTCRRTADQIPAGALLVLPVPYVDAYSLPGRPGRVVVTRGLVGALTPAERRAVLAHEQSHLGHRHHLHLLAGAVAAAANPLLGRIPAALCLTTERWADEDAASQSDRATVFAALARVAALKPAVRRPLHALSLAGAAIAERARALQTSPPKPRLPLVAAGVALVVGAVLAAVLATDHTYHIFELAAAAGRHAAHVVHRVGCLSHVSRCSH